MPTRLLSLCCVLSFSALAASPYVSPRKNEYRPRVELKAKAPEVKKAEVPAADAKAEATELSGTVKELIDGNARFTQGLERRRDMLAERNALTQGQHPRTIVLGCSDSRVPPELLFDESLGELFVVRNAGNVADMVSLASIEYAAEHLHASLLVVLGHERCGAVTAATSSEPMETPNLQALVDEIAPGLATLKARYTGAELVHLGVEANVVATSNEVVERSPLIRKLVEEGKLHILRAVYDLDSGHVRWLNLEDAQTCTPPHAGEALAGVAETR